MITQVSDMIPPSNVKTIGGAYDDNYIKELGDKIALLTLLEAKELTMYLKQKMESFKVNIN